MATLQESSTSFVNIRDVGGLRTVGGTSVVPGVLYRSEAPQFGDDAPEDVPTWPARTVIDLRSAREVEENHPLAGRGVRVHHLPLTIELAPETLVEASKTGNLTPLYLELVERSSDQIALIVDTVASSPGPILIHCAAGKDRTGIVVAILLRLVDVERDAVIADYAKTNERLPELLERLRLAGAKLPSTHGLLGVSPAALEAVLDHLEGSPGGIAAWLIRAGCGADIAQRLRDRLAGA